jgi:hypothetical protein
MGVKVRIAREMARLVASASAICGREVAWNLGEVVAAEGKAFRYPSLVSCSNKAACSEENALKRYGVEYLQRQCELSDLDLRTGKAMVEDFPKACRMQN